MQTYRCLISASTSGSSSVNPQVHWESQGLRVTTSSCEFKLYGAMCRLGGRHRDVWRAPPTPTAPRVSPCSAWSLGSVSLSFCLFCICSFLSVSVERSPYFSLSLWLFLIYLLCWKWQIKVNLILTVRKSLICGSVPLQMSEAVPFWKANRFWRKRHAGQILFGINIVRKCYSTYLASHKIVDAERVYWQHVSFVFPPKRRWLQHYSAFYGCVQTA